MPSSEILIDDTSSLSAVVDAMDEPPELAEVVDRRVSRAGGRHPVRVYTPEGDGAAPGPRRFLHGGGWVIGDLDTPTAWRVAWPTLPAPWSCPSTTGWPLRHAVPGRRRGLLGRAHLGGRARRRARRRPGRLAVGGDSAGGNLAAVAALLAATGAVRRSPCSCSCTPAPTPMAHPSITENGEGYFLTKDMMTWFWATTCRRDADGPEPSPLRVDELGGCRRRW